MLFRRFTWQFLASGVPEGLQVIAPDTYHAECAKFTEQLADVAAKYRLLLREQLTQLVTHLVTRLTPDPDGTTKVLRASATGKIAAFLTSYPR